VALGNRINAGRREWEKTHGVLTFIAQDGGSIKRFRIIPGNTSLETMIAAARPVARGR
jgi:hypothetical protein